MGSLDLRGLKLDELKNFDIQYEREVRVRGLHLRDLIGLLKPIPENVDVILLHTRDGMIVAVSIARLRRDIEVFIAVELWQDGKWTSTFPPAVYKEVEGTKETPTHFTGNKVVVGQDWRASTTGFTPWRHMDSLTGIEFVESSAYYDQFRSRASPEAGLRGRVVFMEYCQFCHGVDGLGAVRGPNLTNVVKAFGKGGWEKIYAQVQKPGAGGMLSHFMPPQKDVGKGEIKDLITWLDSIRGLPLMPYAPTYQASMKWRN